MKQSTEKQLKKTVGLLAGVIALVVTLSVPAGYFFIQQQHLATTLQHTADFIADDISVFAFQHPDSWHYQEHRIVGFLENNLDLNEQQASLISKQYSVDITTGTTEAIPVMIRQASVNNGLDDVAMVETRASVYPIITNTATTFLFSLFLGLMIYVSLYYWPLKALKQALSQLDDAHHKLEIEIMEKHVLLREADKLTKKLHTMAMHDALTGLANRTLFFERLKQSLSIAERTNHKVAIAMIDLDKFKPINDELGHHIGDQLLIEISHRLENSLRKSDTVARLGGDEFALILHIDSDQDSNKLCQKLIRLIENPVHIGEYTLTVMASLGLASYPEHGTTANELLRNADTAMYVAKKTHKRIIVYSHDI